jgi:hypothetical protein
MQRQDTSIARLDVTQGGSISTGLSPQGAQPMKIYDIYGTQYHASICVQDDGQKVWTFDPLWQAFWQKATSQKAIEHAIENEPHASVIPYEGFTIRQRQEPDAT